jgi:hypothetical protein
MQFTDDEIVIIVEALREYRLRIADESRKLVCQALVFRFMAQLVANAKEAFLASEA